MLMSEGRTPEIRDACPSVSGLICDNFSCDSAERPSIIEQFKFIGSKVLRIPPYKRWAYFYTTQGPLKERILGLIESKVLPPLRVRGPYTKEAKEIILAGEQKVRGYKKELGILISRIDRSIYDMLGNL